MQPASAAIHNSPCAEDFASKKKSANKVLGSATSATVANDNDDRLPSPPELSGRRSAAETGADGKSRASLGSKLVGGVGKMAKRAWDSVSSSSGHCVD